MLEIKKIFGRVYDKSYLCLCALMLSRATYAGPIIPVSTDEQTSATSSFATTVMDIVQKDILPIVEVLGAMYLLWKALGGIWSGYEDYQKTKEADKIKQAVINAVILITVGASILFMIDALRKWTP